ncbi:MAG TPA: FliH/SctL family protein [Pirellulales bacterium]|jgi:flagellar assembly protein FliH
MSKVIKADRRTHGVAFNFDDVKAQAGACLEQARAEAARILAAAHAEADAVRAEAEAAGRRAAERSLEERLEQKLAARLDGLAPALSQAAAELQQAKQAWLGHWERQAVHLATAIAERVIRRELRASPQIPIDLVREALQLAAGPSHLRVLMNPGDVGALGAQLAPLLASVGPGATAELIADARIEAGGCRVETEFGSVDQQFAVQLARIEEELL